MGVEGVEDVVEGVDGGVVGAVGGEGGLDDGGQFLDGFFLGYDELVLGEGDLAVVGGGVVSVWQIEQCHYEGDEQCDCYDVRPAEYCF